MITLEEACRIHCEDFPPAAKYNATELAFIMESDHAWIFSFTKKAERKILGPVRPAAFKTTEKKVQSAF